jgi:choline dehydrogenase
MYDHVIVGGGTAGCVLAARLSADPDVRVLLLEAGPASGPAFMADPDRFPALMGTEVDWQYSTVAQAGTAGSVHTWARGKVLGGSSSINAMAHVRGHRSNYDGWEAGGAGGWSYQSLLPYFKRSETAVGRDPAYRGTRGPMLVSPVDRTTADAQAFHAAVVEAGYPATRDINGADQVGAFWYDLNVVDGRRQSSADAYLRPAMARPNLRVVTDATAYRLTIEAGRCTGVEYTVGGEPHSAAADREVIVAAGVIGSPQLLMLSGIGPAGHLRDVGVDVVVDLPGVGENLQDHVQSSLIYRSSRPIHTADNGFCPAGAILRSDPSLPGPDVQLLLLDFPAGAPLPGGCYTISFALLAPHSRGTVRLASADPDVAPLIDPRYYSDERDFTAMLAALRVAREVGESPALAPWRESELLPGQGLDEPALLAYLRHNSRTYFHPTGTCRMGTDELAVVDPRLRVHGIDGLRVVDASVMPTVVTANTNATVLAIAERAAALIRQEPAA